MPTIKIKNSQTTTNTPGSLVQGELAINEQDELLFYRDGAGSVQSFDLTTTSGGTGNVEADFSGNLVFDTASASISTTGNALALTPHTSRGALAALNTTTVAFIDGTNDQLKTYEWNGTDWSQVGNALTITGVGVTVDIDALDSTTIAFVDDGIKQLRTYEWDGSDWSQVGSGLAVSSNFQNSITALDSTTVAVYLDQPDELQTYSWNGSTWSAVGTAYTALSVNLPQIAALDSTNIALIEDTSSQIRTLTWNGSTWSQTGSALTLSGGNIDYSSITALSSTAAVVAHEQADQVQLYTWNGSTWSFSTSLSISVGATHSAVCAFSPTEVAFTNVTADTLRTLDVVESFPRIQDNDTGGLFTGLFSDNDLIRISGTTNNDGLVRIQSVIDANTLNVESITAEGPVSSTIMIDTRPYTTDDLTQGTTNLYYPSADSTKLAGIEAGAQVNDTQAIILDVSRDETTALTTGTGKLTFRMPFAFELTEVRASVTTAPTGSTLIVDINEGGVSILSTTISIDIGETTSTTAATPPVITDTSLADDAEITIDIDQIGSTVAGAGLKITLIGNQP